MQELSILDYSLVHRSAPMKAAGALMAAVSFQTKTLRPYMEEMEVGGCTLDPPQALTSHALIMLTQRSRVQGVL